MTLNSYRASLQERRRQLVARLDLQTPAALDTQVSIDDEASARTELLDVMAGRERLTLELRAIDAALDRMRDGVYGICVACDESIPRARLSVHPDAARCVRCQEQLERPGRPARVRIAGVDEEDDWIPKLPEPDEGC